MCTIYEFPKPIALPKHLEERLEESAKDYVDTLHAIMQYFDDVNYNDEEMTKVVEIVLCTYLQHLEQAIEKL